MKYVDTIRITTEIAISHHGTVLIAMRVNIAMDDVNGMNEHTFIRIVSILPEDMENTTTKKDMRKRKVTGCTEVLISSSLDTVDPIAPNRNA